MFEVDPDAVSGFEILIVFLVLGLIIFALAV